MVFQAFAAGLVLICILAIFIVYNSCNLLIYDQTALITQSENPLPKHFSGYGNTKYPSWIVIIKDFYKDLVFIMFDLKYDLIPVTKDGSWTFHDTRRKNNLPKINTNTDFWNWNTTFDVASESFCQLDRDSKHQILIYNRVHKSGSTTTVSIAHALSKNEYYTIFHILIF